MSFDMVDREEKEKTAIEYLTKNLMYICRWVRFPHFIILSFLFLFLYFLALWCSWSVSLLLRNSNRASHIGTDSHHKIYKYP